eukprot:scaffold25275_cov60-Cyclotella_meneghiniana.AAC.4
MGPISLRMSSMKSSHSNVLSIITRQSKQVNQKMEVPIGMSYLWEAVLLHLLLIYSRDHWGECRILRFTFAKECLKRISSLFANHSHYNGPNSTRRQRFSHGYFAGQLDMRSRQNYRGGPSKAGDSTFYIVSRIFPLVSLDHVRNHVPMYHSLTDIFKSGISYMGGDARIIQLRQRMKARAIAVSTARVENAGEVEIAILSDPTLRRFRKVDQNPIGEYFRNTNACNRGIIKQKVITFCQSRNQTTPTFVDRILGPTNHITPGILLEIILSKVGFFDPNERLLWDSPTFRQASIEDQLACIRMGVNGRTTDLERLVKRELEERFEIDIPPQVNWRALRNELAAINPANAQMTRQECMIYHLENQ